MLRRGMFGVLVLVFGLHATSALACECVGFDQATALAAFPLAFRGTLRSIARADTDDVVTFEVIAAWNGTHTGATVVVHRTHADYTTTECPVPQLAVGARYDVFASGHATPRIDGCNPTHATGTAFP